MKSRPVALLPAICACPLPLSRAWFTLKRVTGGRLSTGAALAGGPPPSDLERQVAGDFAQASLSSGRAHRGDPDHLGSSLRPARPASST